MTQPELDLTAARAGRDQGMAQSLSYAESMEPGWGDRAYAAMEAFVVFEEGRQFTSHAFIAWCRMTCFDMPPTPKAFGAIFTKAARNGLIRKIGYRPHPLRHASPTVLWEVI